MVSKGPFSIKSRPVAAPVASDGPCGVDSYCFLILKVLTSTNAILNKAYGKAATVQTAVNGFKKTSPWPFDPNVFPDYVFEPAEATNIHMQQDRIEPEEHSSQQKT
ncbi:hypothetical protein WA026_022357 [Henosepilachna vigintioctopunctata]|uniref:Uncharacterized protein n=1 Tax=Henosepilachna vigintioctopunctata TaxID=420089 RepID=A0AAW1V3X3_9CUCU